LAIPSFPSGTKTGRVWGLLTIIFNTAKCGRSQILKQTEKPTLY